MNTKPQRAAHLTSQLRPHRVGAGHSRWIFRSPVRSQDSGSDQLHAFALLRNDHAAAASLRAKRARTAQHKTAR